MTDRRVARAVAVVAAAALMTAVLPSLAQVQERQQPRIERPGPTGGPEIRIDPRLPQRPELQAAAANITFRAQFDERMLERASQMRLYRMQRPALDADVMRRVGDDLGLRGDMTRLGDLIGYTTEETGFMMLAPETGRMAFSVNLVDLIDDTPTDLPSEREAQQIAMEFLRENDLLPNAEQAVVAHIGRIRSASFDPGTGQDSGAMDQALVVYFARQVDGFRVVGPGSTAVVQIGAGGGGGSGRIAGGGIQWAALGQPAEIERGQLHSVEAVNSSIRDFLAREHWMANRILVDQVGVFYYDSGGFLQPVVGYQAQITTGELNYQFFGQVPLLQRPPVRVGPEPVTEEMREQLQQPPREGRR